LFPIDLAEPLCKAETSGFIGRSAQGHDWLRGWCYSANSGHVKCMEKYFPSMIYIIYIRDVRYRLKRVERRAKEHAKLRELKVASLL